MNLCFRWCSEHLICACIGSCQVPRKILTKVNSLCRLPFSFSSLVIAPNSIGLHRLGTRRYPEAWSASAVDWELNLGKEARVALARGIIGWSDPLSLRFIMIGSPLRELSHRSQGSWTPEEFMEVLQSPPFRQQLETFSHVRSRATSQTVVLIKFSDCFPSPTVSLWCLQVLRTGQVDLTQFGIDPSKCMSRLVHNMEHAYSLSLSLPPEQAERFFWTPIADKFSVLSFLEALDDSVAKSSGSGEGDGDTTAQRSGDDNAMDDS